jgi:mannose-1-phosphate guanylyltransferase
MHWAAILAGGVGSRFWPLSTPERPKQLLPLAGDAPLVVQAVRRLGDLVPAERVVLITGAALAPRIAQLLPEIPRDQILVEPRAASTAPALTWAAHWIRARDPNASLLSLHADWAVSDDAAFRTTARAALDTAGRHDLLVTVGVKPTRIETGYGYIVPGKRLDKVATRVASFVEKPTARRAAALRKRGALWNCGLFAWTVNRFLVEVNAWARELASGLAALDQGNVDGFFAAVKPIAVDVAVLERTSRLAVVRGTFPWDDVGTWAALPRVRRPDARGNVSVGGRRVALRDARGCIVWAEEGHVVVDGASDLVVVQANGITLVTTRDRAPDLKALLESLPPELRGPA